MLGYRCLAGAVFVLSAGAAAQPPDEWGLFANGAHAGCLDDACAAFATPLTVDEGDGGVNQLNANYALDNDRGTGAAGAGFVGALAVPALTAAATSHPNALVQATATGMQGYEFTAAAPGTITLAVNLTGDIANPDSDALTGLSARVALVQAEGGFDFQDALQLFVYLALNPATPNVEFEVNAGGPVSENANVAIDLEPGDRFFVVATIAGAAAGTGASALSNTTLRGEFVVAAAGDPDPVETLTPSAARAGGGARTIPMLPAAAAVLLTIGVSLLARRRRRRG